MLTEEAIRERKWGPYPTLRQVLENKKLPSNFYGLTSVSDTMFDRIDRLIKIAILIDNYKANIKNAVPTLGRDELSKDLYDVQSELERTAEYFRDMGQHVHSLLADLHA